MGRGRRHADQTCTPCKKIRMTERSARDVALRMRTQIKKASAHTGGYHRTHAYECPHGNGWHVGRAPKDVWEAKTK